MYSKQKLFTENSLMFFKNERQAKNYEKSKSCITHYSSVKLGSASLWFKRQNLLTAWKYLEVTP